MPSMLHDTSLYQTVEIQSSDPVHLEGSYEEHQDMEVLDEATAEMLEGKHEVLYEVSESTTRRLTDSGQIRYFCPQCNVRYVKYKYLKTHIKDCGQEFICPHCNAKFKQRRTFVSHIKQKHEVVKIEPKVQPPF